MEEYYFMRKPEVVDAKDYENPNRVVFNYNPEDSIARQQRDGLSPFNSTEPKKQKKRKTITYVLNIIFILGFLFYLIYEKYYQNPNHAVTEKNRVQFSLNVSQIPESNDFDLTLLVQNQSQETIYLKDSLHLLFFAKTDQKKVIKEKQVLNFQTPMPPSEMMTVVTYRFKSDDQTLIEVGVIINGKEKLAKSLIK